MSKRTLQFAVCATLAALALGEAAAAGPVRLVVAFPPGGPADQIARAISKQLETELKNTVIVENKPGGNGSVAAIYVAKSPTDGSVLFLSSVGAISINPSLYPNLTYDPVKDLAPVSLVVNATEMLVVPTADPARTAAEFVANSRKAAKPPTIASSGVGSMPHMAIEQLRAATSVDFLHVAYKGAAPAVTDTIGGQVNAFIGDVPGILGFVKSGRLKALGVAAPARLSFMPEVPTLAEQGIANVEAINWYGMFAPAGTPANVVAALNQATHRALQNAEVKSKLVSMGVEPAPNTPAAFAELIRRDTVKWSRIVKENKIQGD
jgi:tripartite-type tricarboxylate transporter receptor subunit TctC